MMRTHQIDVVLTDLAMEPIDGCSNYDRLLRNAPDSPARMAQ